MSKAFSVEEVSSHNKPTDLLIIVNEDVYDLTKFQDDHPGGKKSMYMIDIDIPPTNNFVSPPKSSRQRCFHSIRQVSRT
jgi:hypothetical protein